MLWQAPGWNAVCVESSGIVTDDLLPEAGVPDDGSPGPEPLERDPKLQQLATRAAAAGLAARWGRYTGWDGQPEGPYKLKIELPSGRRSRDVVLSPDQAETFSPFVFERWIALTGYEAILDTDRQLIIAEVRLGGRTPLKKIPGAFASDQGDGNELHPSPESVRSVRSSLQDVYRLVVPAINSGLSIELYSPGPVEIAALHGRQSSYGCGLTIHGVRVTRHDDALDLLLDLSTSFFVDLDIGYGLTANLARSYDPDLVPPDDYDNERPRGALPRFPTARHDRDAASLYLYGRQLTLVPLLEYLVYYQVIEYHMPTYARLATIGRLRNLLKDPGFDYSSDLALGRLLDAVAPTGRTVMSERAQVAAAITACVDDAMITTFLEDRPAATKALSDKRRIPGVRLINARDRQTPLTVQVAERIYDLRCRIVHSKENDELVSPIRPFGPESRLMRRDLSLVRFIAQRVLIASSRPASW